MKTWAPSIYIPDVFHYVHIFCGSRVNVVFAADFCITKSFLPVASNIHPYSSFHFSTLSAQISGAEKVFPISFLIPFFMHYLIAVFLHFIIGVDTDLRIGIAGDFDQLVIPTHGIACFVKQVDEAGYAVKHRVGQRFFPVVL